MWSRISHKEDIPTWLIQRHFKTWSSMESNVLHITHNCGITHPQDHHFSISQSANSSSCSYAQVGRRGVQRVGGGINAEWWWGPPAEPACRLPERTSTGTCWHSLPLLWGNEKWWLCHGTSNPPISLPPASLPQLTISPPGWCQQLLHAAAGCSWLRGGRHRSLGVKVACTDWHIDRLTDRL